MIKKQMIYNTDTIYNMIYNINTIYNMIYNNNTSKMINYKKVNAIIVLKLILNLNKKL